MDGKPDQLQQRSPLGSAFGSSGPISTGTWISMDVTAYFTGNGTYNLALTTPCRTQVSLASSQSGANAPQLIIETSPWVKKKCAMNQCSPRNFMRAV